MLILSCPRACLRAGVVCRRWLWSWLSCRLLLGCPSALRSTAGRCCTRASCRCGC
jgi:hypothetical protein